MTSSQKLSPSSSRRLAGRVLAVDYGRKRLGLALSDELGLTARPLATLERTNRNDDLRRLRELAREHGVALILVGHPVHLDGSSSEMAAEAARFAERVRKQLGLPVEMVDERLSSWEAQQAIAATRRAPGGKAGPARRGELDQVAAAVILRDYLARPKRQVRS